VKTEAAIKIDIPEIQATYKNKEHNNEKIKR
jgi:hypothetical protein